MPNKGGRLCGSPLIPKLQYITQSPVVKQLLLCSWSWEKQRGSCGLPRPLAQQHMSVWRC